jgi:hypothetical protein
MSDFPFYFSPINGVLIFHGLSHVDNVYGSDVNGADGHFGDHDDIDQVFPLDRAWT